MISRLNGACAVAAFPASSTGTDAGAFHEFTGYRSRFRAHRNVFAQSGVGNAGLRALLSHGGSVLASRTQRGLGRRGRRKANGLEKFSRTVSRGGRLAGLQLLARAGGCFSGAKF